MGVPPDISDSCRLASCHLGMGEAEGQERHPLPLSRVVVQLVCQIGVGLSSSHWCGQPWPALTSAKPPNLA